MEIGQTVGLHSLQAKPEMNGRQGTVVSFESTTGRVGVKLEDGKTVSLKQSNLLVTSTTKRADVPDAKALARFVTTHSIRANDATKRLFAAEMRRGGAALGGSWCCLTSSLWCPTCAANLAYSGVEEEVADNIPMLLGLPRSDFDGSRHLPGELEAALHLIQRIADHRKPLGQVVLDNLSKEERRRICQEITRHGGLTSREYTNAWGMTMLGVCNGARRLSDIVSLTSLAAFYLKAELLEVSDEIQASCGRGVLCGWRMWMCCCVHAELVDDAHARSG